MFYLASRSPRRAQLLEAVGLEFSVLPPDVAEDILDGEAPEQTVERLAREKAAAGMFILHRDALPSHPVLAADTVVVVEGRILGKPERADEAYAMLEILSGRRHRVLTSVALHLGASVQLKTSESFVTLKSLARWEIERYWATGEPRDKAGGYAIQGIGGGFVARLEGSYSAVVGLPMFETRELLAIAGIGWL
ncbi:MAG: Maf family protein [Arenicellales bacterium]|jgi:septum formation protein